MGYHILITGGAGMIGSNLVRRLSGQGHRVTVVDNLWRGKREYLSNEDGSWVIDMDRDFHELDLSRPDQLDALLPGVDYVYHLADIVAGVDYVFSNQLEIFRQNLLINTNVVASVARFRDLKGYIYVGTACSFPEQLQTGVDAAPLKEENLFPASPESAYGWSKLMGQYEAQLLARDVGIPISLPMLHNVYGAPCDFSPERSQVIPSLVRKAIAYPSEAFVIWGSGQQGRAFVHIEDIVDGLVLCLERGLGQGFIQLGPDYCTSIATLAETIVEISGKPIDLKFDLSKPEGDRGRCADFEKARTVLGWSPRVELKDGLESMYRWVEARYAEQQAVDPAA